MVIGFIYIEYLIIKPYGQLNLMGELVGAFLLLNKA
jgi:hypothetical protein